MILKIPFITTTKEHLSPNAPKIKDYFDDLAAWCTKYPVSLSPSSSSFPLSLSTLFPPLFPLPSPAHSLPPSLGLSSKYKLQSSTSLKLKSNTLKQLPQSAKKDSRKNKLTTYQTSKKDKKKNNKIKIS